MLILDAGVNSLPIPALRENPAHLEVHLHAVEPDHLQGADVLVLGETHLHHLQHVPVGEFVELARVADENI